MSTTLPSVTDERIDRLLDTPSVQRAFSYFDSHAEAITEEQLQINSIPAPPFGEARRAAYIRQKLFAAGLTSAQIDDEGNCVALRRGISDEPLLVVSAHLDTVFPLETDLTPRSVGAKLFAPGIADDACGLVALIAVASALKVCEIKTAGSILFVGTVGEEGRGNLRGVRHLFTKGEWAGRINAFISFDGAGLDRITNGALGSRRYRVEFRGAGGHSWSDFGTANPVHALARAVARLASYPAPTHPRTTFNVGRIEGGQGVNAIPREASMDVDLRSTSGDELLKLDAFFRRSVREAADEENVRRSSGTEPLAVVTEMIGERPGGETRETDQLVTLAWAATEAVGGKASLDQASTDSNLPISLGIPAITLGGGGTSANSHTPDEWYDPRNRAAALKRALLVMLGFVGLQNS
ncbi:MAG TPA: M20/M25/M40 family metallo-hydrolase [Pyrinomonadaceae bacterium]|jgi:acetylornithine deacetylase/succinyl-diaminopimelate desuccinylase-like protein|nr:M20/M25/M40 family metallo-hydrolase [Pyrinomonadaceae bacterium]